MRVNDGEGEFVPQEDASRRRAAGSFPRMAGLFGRAFWSCANQVYGPIIRTMFTVRLAGTMPVVATSWLLAGAIFCAGLAAGHWLQPAVSGVTPASIGPPVEPVFDPRGATGAVYPVDVLRINDGDTFEARVRIWPGLEVTTKVRLRNVDTAELNARCAEEYRKADTARAALQRMLNEGGVRIAQVGLDKYGGRVLADVSTRATPDVADALLKAGHARSYGGGRREDWCG